MHYELYGVERVHNSPFMQKVQNMGRLRGLNALADKNSPITFIKWLKKNKTVLYAIDQDYGLKNSSNVDFFGIKTATTNAPVKIVDATQCNVLFLNSYYDSDKLILSVEEINISDSKSMIQDISSHVESRIREKTSEYLFFTQMKENSFMSSLQENVERDLLSRLAPIAANLRAILA